MPTITNVDNCIVPFLQPEDERGAVLGTGTFCEAGGHYFLVTAAHVTDEADTGHFGAGFFLGAESTQRIATNVPSSGRRIDDMIDIAVILLSREAGLRFRERGRVPLGIGDWNMTDRATPGQHYVFTGFTHADTNRDRTRQMIEPRRVSVDGVTFSDERIQQLGLDPRLHIVALYDRRRVINQHGNVGMGPRPAGMSGGPVWTRDAASENLRWVGIGIEHRSDHRALVGTRIGAIIYMLRFARPEFAEVLPTL